jgi:hypothetical protein
MDTGTSSDANRRALFYEEYYNAIAAGKTKLEEALRLQPAVPGQRS